MVGIRTTAGDKDRKLIAVTLKRLELVRQWAVSDRQKLRDAECTLEGNVFSALFEVQLLEELVAGHATTIVKYGSFRDVSAGDELSARDLVFGSGPFREWFLTVGEEYPRFCAYVGLLDYLRIRLLSICRSLEQSAPR